MNTNKKQYLRGLNLLSTVQNIESISGGVNRGCNLYVGFTSSEHIPEIQVKNIYGDVVEFFNPIQGSILPFSFVEILDIKNTGKIVALW